jgi:hypothetical protein
LSNLENVPKRRRITATYVITLAILGILLAIIVGRFVMPHSETFDGDAVKQRPSISEFISQRQAEDCKGEPANAPSGECVSNIALKAKEQGYDFNEVDAYLKQQFPNVQR